MDTETPWRIRQEMALCLSSQSIMTKKTTTHLVAVAQALLVTFLWATSWVLIKLGLVDLPALTFAGLRYCLAALCLLPFVLTHDRLAALRRLKPVMSGKLVTLGLLFITLTQGAQFLGLAYLPAVTVNLLLNFTSIIVALLGVLLLGEKPTRTQWVGIVLTVAGATIYFHPVTFPANQTIGLAAVVVGVLANAASSLLGRHINRSGDTPPVVVTAISMSIGAPVLLGTGLAVQGAPQLTATHWLIIAWLAIVNTAFAFTLWNHTLHTLPAMESSIINNTMLIQIPVLAVVFLGEQLNSRQIAGLAIAVLGTLLVQVRRRPSPIGHTRITSSCRTRRGDRGAELPNS